MGINPVFHRVELVTGRDNWQKLQETRVIIFGIGGVGSWCAESLIRSGIGHLTIVDSDRVCITNVNRQLQATTKTVGEVKVEALKEQLLSINPRADITAVEKIYSKESAHEFDLDSYDYVIDAIDSLAEKVELIKNACLSSATLFSSLGAACKIDPSRIKVADIWKSFGCPLGSLVRKRLRKQKFYKKFKVVFSDELLENGTGEVGCGTGNCVCPKVVDENGEKVEAHEWCSSKKQINGSLVHITGTFGFMLCGLVLQDVTAKNRPLTRIR